MGKLSIVLLLSFLGLACSEMEVEFTPENAQLLNKAHSEMADYADSSNAHHLQLAKNAISALDPEKEQEAGKEALKDTMLYLWLEWIDLIDRDMDMNFDMSAAPEQMVSPPDPGDGTQLRPNADPALIKDPALRAEYEKALEANRRALDQYTLQVSLSKLNASFSRDFPAFLEWAFDHENAEARSAYHEAIEAVISRSHRAATLRAMW